MALHLRLAALDTVRGGGRTGTRAAPALVRRPGHML